MINRACWALIIVLLSASAEVSDTEVVSAAGIAVIVNTDNPVDQFS